MNELTRYAHDLIATQCKNLIFVLPSDGSMRLSDFRKLQAIVFTLEPSFNLTIKKDALSTISTTTQMHLTK